MLYVGDTFYDTFTVVNNQRQPVTGINWIAEVNTSPDGSPIAYNVSELGNGAYRIAWVATQAGPYFVQLRSVGEVDGEVIRYGIPADADGLNPASPISLQNVGNTLADMIRITAQRLRDYRRVKATKPGTTTSMIDELSFVEASNHFRGVEIYFTGGSAANLGLSRRIYTSDIESQSVSFIPALPSPTAEGDTAELFNFDGGFRRWEYKDAVNNVIRSGAPATDLLIQQTIDTPYDWDGGTVVVPDILDSIGTVQFLDWNGKWYDVPPAAAHQNNGWYVNPANRTITIGYPIGAGVHTRSLRVIGYAPHPVLNQDNEFCGVDAEWVTTLAAQQLLASRRNPADFGLVGQLKNDADIVRAKMAFNYRLPNNIRLR